MSDWVDSLDDNEKQAWNDIVRHARTKTFEALNQSAFVISLVPSGKPDVKFSLELGMSIMMDKPIIAVVQSGSPVPGKLRAVADEIVEIKDIDTEEGQKEMIQAISRIMARMNRP